MSAHREPDKVADDARNARMRALRVIIAGAGLSVALPAWSPRTRICRDGVPLTSFVTSVAAARRAAPDRGRRRLGCRWRAVGVDNAGNAAVLAARILES